MEANTGLLEKSIELSEFMGPSAVHKTLLLVGLGYEHFPHQGDHAL